MNVCDWILSGVLTPPSGCALPGLVNPYLFAMAVSAAQLRQKINFFVSCKNLGFHQNSMIIYKISSKFNEYPQDFNQNLRKYNKYLQDSIKYPSKSIGFHQLYIGFHPKIHKISIEIHRNPQKSIEIHQNPQKSIGIHKIPSTIHQQSIEIQFSPNSFLSSRTLTSSNFIKNEFFYMFYSPF